MKSTAEQLDELSPQRRELLRRMLEERAAARRGPAVPDIRRREGDGPVPLSFAQQRLWFIDQLEPGTSAYNMPFPLRLRGGLDGRVLERALGEITRRHESLRTVFSVLDGEPVQIVHPPAPVLLPVVDLRGLREEAREREARRLAGEEAGRPFDLARGPLLRSTLLRLDERDDAVLFTMHHIVSDGWSMGVLVNEVSALYAAFAEGRPSPLPELPLQYPDYALWQREHLAGARLDEQIRYWKERLADAPPLLELPTDRPRPAVEDPRAALAGLVVPEGTARGLRALTRSEGGTLFVVLLAGLQALLARWSGQEDVLVGSPVANRTRVELEGLIGFFVNTLVMRTDLSGDPTARGLVARVRAGMLEAQSHQDLPFERLVEEVQPERSLAHSPLFQVLFTLRNTEAGSLELGRSRLEPMAGGGETAKFDLTFGAEERGDRVAVSLSYRSALWDAATIRRMLEHFLALLAGMAADPGARVRELELLSGAEREQVVNAWNATDAGYPAGGGLRALFEARAARAPDVPAAVFGAESLTYAELDRRADHLAMRLRALGAGVDSRVGLCVERSLEMLVGVLGTLKAGAAYVPIDPAYPEDRVAYMLEDAGISVLLTQARLVERLPEFGGEIVLVDTEDANALPHSRTPALSHSPPSPDALAYVVYTSGSTGRPKGVAMPQRPLLNLLAWQLRSWHGPAAARTLQFASISFDVSFQEMFSTWASGGTLLVVPEEVRADMARLARFLAEARVERIFLPFIALQHLAEAAEAEGIVPASLREVVTAGEQLRVTEPIRRWLGRMPGCVLVNQYGPSETHVVTALALGGEAEAWPLLPNIGGPIANTRCYVLERGLGPAPLGVPGELFLGGDGVARGYLGRPELTAEKFVPDPFGPRRGARLYRTGDRARWLASGEIEFLGRVDQQVKVRGFRIEPGEVEAALEAHPAVREAVVVAREDAPGDRRLVAYLVAAGETAPGAAELRAWLAARLPEYMVPAAFVALETLPLTPSGKLHRRALPAPDAAAAVETYAAPRTPAEATLAGIFAAVLRRERVGVHDGFFALGGHSLLATRVASRVRDAFGAELPLRALFETPTVAGLAERIERIRGEDAPAPAPIPRRRGDGPVPLSFAQQRLWLIDRMEPGSAAYNMPAGLRLGGDLDVFTLRRTLSGVVRRHESLRTVFGVRDGEPVQTVLPAAPARLPVVELGGLAQEARERELRRLAAEEAARPFDLARGPLLRSTLVRLRRGESAVLFTLHHAVSDGWSMGVLVNEVSALYAAFAEGRPSPLPELPVQYPDYALWQREWLTGGVLEAQLAFWRGRLAGAPPVLELPTDHPRPPVPGARGGAVPFFLSDGATRGLRALAQREGTTLFGVLLAGFAATLARWSGQDDVVVGTPVAGRTRSELEGLIGFFVNTLPLRTELGGDPTLRELVARARETVLGAQAHQDVPFERLVEELQPERSLQHTPLFQVMLALQNNERGELHLGGLEMAPLGGGVPVARFDLELSLAEEGGRLGGSALFRAALWERATVARMMEHLRTALEALAADPDRRLSALELLTGDERARVLGAWNDTARAYPAAPAHLLFAAAARRAPDAVALAFDGGALTYAELDARSDALALRLRGTGVGPETRVGLCVERTPEMVVGVLGIWKAGGAYVPLDPAYPAERLELIARDAALRLVVASADAAAAVPRFDGRIVALDTPHPPAPSPTRGEGEHDSVEDANALSHSRTPALSHSQLAYVIYTSGSTGTPKGVLVEHGALANLLHATREAFEVGPGDVMPSLASFAFDVWLFETVLPLTVGATARLVARERVLDPARLVEEVADATLLHAVPALMRQVVREVRASPGRLARVRRAFVGGDLVPPDLLAEMRGAFPGAVSSVTYGPTEAAVLASRHGVPAEGAVAGHRIGAPLGNVRLYVCDALGGAQPAGVPGERLICGAQVARGYLGRPELTADKFVPDPFAAEPGARAYRSGDRARWLPSGELEFLGRTDAQVKIRGFRIEPGEVEAVLARHPAVRDAAVVVREDAPGERRLVAYVAAADGAGADAAELRAHLRGRLPEYMVPSAVVVLESLPLTPTGKVDRRALPAPEGAAEESVAPRTPAEATLAGIWAEVLGAERVGVHDDFFALGGHSLLATRVAARVQEAFGLELPLRAVFEAPTVAGLAERLEAAGPGPGTAPPLRRVPRDGPLPASFAQQRLWFIDRLHPGSTAYNLPFAMRLRGAVDPRALRAALTGLVARHETLRTTFAEADGGAVQVIHPPAPARI
ncbi:MAG TPA: amino acid adenylation domain-containing protein, partial [Longimicrobiaceae bacterium]|nr:amino acid adenylation domain-containing protein [Longimicrobiaceae bacterium]